MWRSKLRALGVLCVTRRQLHHARDRFGLRGLVQVHHVIPRSCRDHSTLKQFNFDVESAGNFVLMPTIEGQRQLRLRTGRLTHNRGHMQYCNHITERLDAIRNESELVTLLHAMHVAMRASNPEVPWR